MRLHSMCHQSIGVLPQIVGHIPPDQYLYPVVKRLSIHPLQVPAHSRGMRHETALGIRSGNNSLHCKLTAHLPEEGVSAGAIRMSSGVTYESV